MHSVSTLRRIFNRDVRLILAILLISAILLLLPGYDRSLGGPVERARARVLTVDNSDVQKFGIISAGSQALTVEILSGPYKGQETPAINTLLGKMETDKVFATGDVAFIVLDNVAEGRVTRATAYDHYRLDTELLLVLLFALLLIGFAGWGGIKALLSFAFALLVMWKLLFPGVLLGYDPLWLALGVVVLITAATLYLVAGVNKIALVALLGSLLGILLTICLALLLLPPFHLHGAIQPFSETLLYSGFENLDLTRVFLSAIFIGASGAVLDVAIDVATAMNEVIEKRPDLRRRELVKSGFTVGRNMTSTMVTTLLMAYTSGYMALLMVFMAQGIPPLYLLNTNYVAAEILKTVVGSLGLVTVAPFTAIVGGFIFVAPQAAPILETESEAL
ncbi:MAG: YibE/F family protein [Anaerolineae bacterium]|nr:YibE/F family protein [Anaerolineae bacterium]